MSNLIFPAPPVTTPTPTAAYLWPITKYPEYATALLQSASLRGEMARSFSQYPIWQFDFDFALLTGDLNLLSSYLSTLVGFVMAVRGPYQTWLFSDPYDNNVGSVPVTFATGDNATKIFQITRPIGAGVDIVQNLNGAPAIYLGGALQSSGYTVNSTGIVTFATAPGPGVSLAWTGNFYYRCRFNDDKVLSQLKQIVPSTWQIHSLAWHSVIL